MAETRAGHTATLLEDGKVLVAGGVIDPDGEQVLASTDLYDPATRAWTTVEDMAGPRSAHTATLLLDGRVLVVGGIGRFVTPMEARMLASAELFDPATGRWTSAEESTDPRSGHAATLLRRWQGACRGWRPRIWPHRRLGRGVRPTRWIMVGHRRADRGPLRPHRHADGQWCGAPGRWRERRRSVGVRRVHDLRSERWSATTNLAAARTRHTATLLTDGNVIVVGGNDLVDGVVPVAELYDPGSGS